MVVQNVMFPFTGQEDCQDGTDESGCPAGCEDGSNLCQGETCYVVDSYLIISFSPDPQIRNPKLLVPIRDQAEFRNL